MQREGTETLPYKAYLQGAQQGSLNNGAEFDIDAFIESLPEEVRQQALQNPQMLEELLAEQLM